MDRPRLTHLTRLALASSLSVGLSVGFGLGCYHGFDIEDKQPPSGYPGGKCVADACYAGAECYVDENVCLDPLDPCKGIYCAGYGACGLDLDTNLPFCTCDPGYESETYAYFCVPMGL